MTLTRTIATISILSLTTFANAADSRFPESMVSLRAQPAVFFVRATADVDLTVPKSVTVNLEVLNEDIGRVKGTGAEKQAVVDRAWDLISQRPEKYLLASEEKQEWFMPNSNGWGGSAFAISKEGILLTNAHVVSSDSEQPLTERSWELLLAPIAKHIGEIEEIVGHQTVTPVRIQKTLLGLFPFYGSRSRADIKFKSARVILDYQVDAKKAFSLLKQNGVDAALAMKREEISVPVTVLDVGESLPGKDVAILKVMFEHEEQARLKRLGPPGLDKMLADIQNDRLVCLPLGNSDDLLPQARVQALGFPGIAFCSEMMDTSARFKVSSRGGQISQFKRMSGSGGWDAVEMSTGIEHGDSGGPVLDASGHVIAINVGSAEDKPGILRLAVPIKLAKEMLVKLGIKPDPGELSAHWEKGLRLFEQKKYQDALDEIQAAIKVQQGGSVLAGREVSWYLKDMSGRCLQKLGKIPAAN